MHFSGCDELAQRMHVAPSLASSGQFQIYLIGVTRSIWTPPFNEVPPMFRPSLLLTIMTAMFAAETTTVSASQATRIGTTVAQNVNIEEMSEDQRTVAEARRTLGNELSKL
jgi:hypothetical protein